MQSKAGLVLTGMGAIALLGMLAAPIPLNAQQAAEPNPPFRAPDEPIGVPKKASIDDRSMPASVPEKTIL